MNIRRPRRALAAAATVTALAITGISDIATAADQTLVGVKSVQFAWTPPSSGVPTGYRVFRSLNGGLLQPYAAVSNQSIQIPVAPGDQLAIAVAGVGYDSSGAYRVGPLSPLSDRVSILPAPTFPVAGAWLLLCPSRYRPSCPALARRSLADASVVGAQASALAWPWWRVLGRATLELGRDDLVWHNAITGELAVWNALKLAPVPGAVGVAATALRGVGGADFDRDGVEDFLTQRTDTGLVSAWRVTSAGFQQFKSWPAASTVRLVAARDFDRDGKIDLLWHDTVAGTLDLWKLTLDPVVSGLPLSSLVKGAPVRLASGLASDATVASTGDYDGDGYLDVLWRFGNGRLAITYLTAGRVRSYVPLPAAPDDVNQRVVASLNIDGVPGDEIALQHGTTKAISIVNPRVTSTPARTTVVNPGSQWTVVGAVF